MIDVRIPSGVADLVARQQITDCIVKLFVSTDARDWAGVRSCFTDTVYFDMTSLAGGTPATLSADQIVAGWTQGLAPIESVHHQASNFQITVRGDEADASCYGIALHYRRTAAGRNIRTFVGSYDFTVVNPAGDAWRISAFRFRLKFTDGNPDLEHDG